MSIDKNPQAMTTAYKRVKRAFQKIQEFGIKAESTEEELEALIERLAEIKAIQENESFDKHVKGQRWYVENLHKYTTMTSAEVFDEEYDSSFGDVATEEELLASLDRIRMTA